MEIAVGEFITRGYDATSMEDLSRAAGITKSSFYHHFASKEALLRAALDRSLAGLFALLEEPGATTGTPLQRLRHIVRGQVAVLQRELPYVTLLLRVRGNTESERWALARRREFDARLAELVRAAVEAGELRAGVDPDPGRADAVGPGQLGGRVVPAGAPPARRTLPDEVAPWPRSTGIPPEAPEEGESPFRRTAEVALQWTG
jgi:AcrR family transcriptional regulator